MASSEQRQDVDDGSPGPSSGAGFPSDEDKLLASLRPDLVGYRIHPGLWTSLFPGRFPELWGGQEPNCFAMAFPVTRSLKKLFLGECSGGAEPIYKQAMRSLDGSDTFRLGLLPPWDGPQATSKWHRSWRIVVCSHWHPAELRYLRPRLRLERVCRGLSDWGDYLWHGGDIDLLTFVTEYNNALALESEDSGLESEEPVPVPEGKGKGKGKSTAAAVEEKADRAAIDNDNSAVNVEAKSAAPEGDSEIAAALREYRTKLAAIEATTAATHKSLLAAAAVKEDVEFVAVDAEIAVMKDAITADSGTDAVAESECATIVGDDVELPATFDATTPVPESASSVVIAEDKSIAPATIDEEEYIEIAAMDAELTVLNKGIASLEKTIATLVIGLNSIRSERAPVAASKNAAVATENPASEKESSCP